MRLFFTGAAVALATQENAKASLGGYLSSTPVPNGRKNGLFSDQDSQQQLKSAFNMRGVILKNETGGGITNVYLYSVPDSNGSTTFDLPNATSVGYFAVSGGSGETVTLTIPEATADTAHKALYDRVVLGSVGGGDSWSVGLDDTITQVVTTLHIKSAVISGTNAVITFLAPDYTALGLVFGTTVIDTNAVVNYTLTSLDKTNEFEIEVAAVSVASDSSMERINDERSIPYTGTFYNITGEGNRVLLTASLLDAGVIGLWIKKTNDAKTIVACDALEDALAAQEIEEILNLVFDYT